jgi:single-strand DNA-binding protein
MNLVILTGNLVRDPEKSTASSGMAITRFTLAVNRIRKGSDGNDADFIRVVLFDKSAEVAAQYLRKGSKVAVEGRIQTGSYEKDGRTIYTTDVIGNRFDFLDRKGDSDGSNYGGQSNYAPQSNYAAAPPAAPGAEQASALPPGFGSEDDDDEDMPF